MSYKVCSVCNNELPVGRTRFCSESCSYHAKLERAALKRSNIKLDPIDCQTCGKTFNPRTTRQKYCDIHCWHVEYNKRRVAKRALIAKQPKVKPAERFHPSWQSPTFGERVVTTAEFVNCDTPERRELKSAVKEFLKKGGTITRYGDQIPTVDIQTDLTWQLPESEEKKIQAELQRIWGVEDVLGN